MLTGLKRGEMTASSDTGPTPRYRLKPIARLGWWASSLIGVTGITVAMMGASWAWSTYILVQVRRRVVVLDEQSFLLADVLVILSTIVFSLFLIAGGIVFLLWVYRAASNVWAIRPDGMTISPAWAVGWYFVPIWSFWKPYQAFRQIWRASNDVDAPGSVPLPKSIFRWWLCWMVANFYAAIVFVNRFLREFPEDASGLGELEALINAYGSVVACSIFLAAACFFLFRIIREITRVQETMASSRAAVFE
jgi:hypothetical protein